jgi:2'-5' RNA ligase
MGPHPGRARRPIVRLFVGIPIGPDCVARARTLLAELQARTHAIAPRARVTWAAPDRLHLTLQFVGEVDEARGRAVTAALTAPARLLPFDMELAGIGTFPDRGAPRVLWVGVGAGRDALDALRRETGARLRAAGWRDDGKPFHPHFTLARVREPDGLGSRGWLGPVAARSLGITRVTEATLFTSVLRPEGAVHTALCRMPLDR